MASSHLMKTTRRGRPFIKDVHDLFSTLIVSLQLGMHRQYFKTYENSFTTDEASSNLASLKFSQSNRAPDPKDPTRIITTTTTTTFSMTRDMAKGICQHFMDANLIENAADIGSTSFKDRGIYMLTPKGLHILERFITKNGISADHLLRVFAVQPICMKILHLERRAEDDEIKITKSVVEMLFGRFVGRAPNITKLPDDQFIASQSRATRTGGASSAYQEEMDRMLGILLKKSFVPAAKGKTAEPAELVFLATAALDWLIDFTTIGGRDEAADMAAHFVRYGLIKLVNDKAAKVMDHNRIAVVKGGPVAPGGAIMQEAEFRYGEKTLYRITLEGCKCAKWDNGKTAARSLSGGSLTQADLASRSSEDLGDQADKTGATANANAAESNLIRRRSITDRLRLERLDIKDGTSVVGQVKVDMAGGPHHKDSHTVRLQQILEEQSQRSLFREFLRSNYCEENLSFWMEIQDFKKRFNTTSSAAATPGQRQKDLNRTVGHQAMERHQQELIAMAFIIYNTFLAPASESELNIDHGIREELVNYISKIVAEVSSKIGAGAVSGGTLDPAMAAKTLSASQLQTMVRLYERIQGHVFRLMATDSVPKFCKTDRYIELMQRDFGHDVADNSKTGSADPKRTSSRDSEDGSMSPSARAFVTISQAANEKYQQLLERKLHSVKGPERGAV